jgi:hypothetical protein
MMYGVALCTPSELRFVLPVKWNKKVKGYNKTKCCRPFWNAKCYEFYIHGVFINSVKHCKNSLQIDFAMDHGNSYTNRETLLVFLRAKPAHIVALICH